MSERITPSLPAERSPDDVRADRETLIDELLTVFERHAGEVSDAELAATMFQLSEAIARHRCVPVGVSTDGVPAERAAVDDVGILTVGGRELTLGAPQWATCPRCDGPNDHSEEKWPADELAAKIRPEGDDA